MVADAWNASVGKGVFGRSRSQVLATLTLFLIAAAFRRASFRPSPHRCRCHRLSAPLSLRWYTRCRSATEQDRRLYAMHFRVTRRICQCRRGWSGCMVGSIPSLVAQAPAQATSDEVNTQLPAGSWCTASWHDRTSGWLAMRMANHDERDTERAMQSAEGIPRKSGGMGAQQKVAEIRYTRVRVPGGCR